MSLMDDINAEKRMTGTRCAVRTVLASMDGPAREELAAAIEDRGVSSGAIERALKRRGVHLGESSVQRHRRGACRCGDT